MITCLLIVELICWIMAAMVELLPFPAAPETNTNPRSVLAISSMTLGSPSISIVGTLNGIARITTMNDERWRNRLTLKRPIPGAPHEQS